MKVVSALAFVALAAFGAAAESFEIDRIGEIRCEGERLVRASGGNGKDVRLDSAKPIRVIEAFQSGVSSVTVGDAEEAERLGRKIGNIYAKRSYPPRHTNTVWKLAEEFRFTNALDRSLWKQFAHHPWQQKRPETIITNEDLAYVGGGVLHLVGALNPKIDDLYSYPCRCGRVKTEGTLNIHYGKVEIDVKMEDQKGSLFALWMMPQERVGTWPLCGEIDIIERLNDEEAVWQTEHNYRADKLSINQNPRNHAHPAVKTREWTTYGLEWYPDELVWTVNGKPTHRYPKISDHQEDWPWTNPQYLRMEMIMENKEWAGPFDPATLPCEARIRSVRFYTGEIDGKPFGKVYRLGGPRVSILGDSYSTYEDAIPRGNANWYFAAPRNQNDVTKVEECWWSLAIRMLGGTLERNESWSGSTVCTTGYGGKDATQWAFVNRVDRLGDPDLVLICGATNDSWANSPIGGYKYEGWTAADLKCFRPAMAKMLADVKRLYPKARIHFVLNDGLKAEINDSVHEICAHYKVPCVDLRGIAKQKGHPSVAGMKSIAEQVAAAVGSAETRLP